MDLSVQGRRKSKNLGGVASTMIQGFLKGKVWLQFRLKSGGVIAPLEPVVPTALWSKNIAETP